jgi:hypothetical protein
VEARNQLRVVLGEDQGVLEVVALEPDYNLDQHQGGLAAPGAARRAGHFQVAVMEEELTVSMEFKLVLLVLIFFMVVVADTAATHRKVVVVVAVALEAVVVVVASNQQLHLVKMGQAAGAAARVSNPKREAAMA